MRGGKILGAFMLESVDALRRKRSERTPAAHLEGVG
jgi:hypothetical protein